MSVWIRITLINWNHDLIMKSDSASSSWLCFYIWWGITNLFALRWLLALSSRVLVHSCSRCLFMIFGTPAFIHSSVSCTHDQKYRRVTDRVTFYTYLSSHFVHIQLLTFDKETFSNSHSHTHTRARAHRHTHAKTYSSHRTHAHTRRHQYSSHRTHAHI